MNKINRLLNVNLLIISIIFICISTAFADVVINMFAVNGSDSPKVKHIHQSLPKEIKRAEDVLDTSGLRLDYDPSSEQYFVDGDVTVAPKESKTIRIKVKDVWQLDQEDIKYIKEQVDESIKRLDGTEFVENSQLKKDQLLNRLNFIAEEQKKFADDAGKRIDQYRTYQKEIDEMKKSAISVKYWRSKASDQEEQSIIKIYLSVENPSKEFTFTTESKHYLPKEVKPEHVVDTAGFDIRYDPVASQSYLTKEVKLNPAENKKFEISVVNVWKIPQSDIENLKDRTRRAFKALEKTNYANTANILIERIKKNLDFIEESQSREKGLKETIGDYRVNADKYQMVLEDVRSLEEILDAVRENLERSKIKNVLEKIESLKNIREFAQALFKTKFKFDQVMMIILGVIIFVGLITISYFAISGKRSREVKIEDTPKSQEEKEKTSV